METSALIEARLREHLEPELLEIEDESHRHRGHAGAAGGGGHYVVTIVSKAFQGKSLLQQHRMVFALLEQEMKQSIHALALHTFSPEQWSRRQG